MVDHPQFHQSCTLEAWHICSSASMMNRDAGPLPLVYNPLIHPPQLANWLIIMTCSPPYSLLHVLFHRFIYFIINSYIYHPNVIDSPPTHLLDPSHALYATPDFWPVTFKSSCLVCFHLSLMKTPGIVKKPSHSKVFNVNNNWLVTIGNMGDCQDDGWQVIGDRP